MYSDSYDNTKCYHYSIKLTSSCAAASELSISTASQGISLEVITLCSTQQAAIATTLPLTMHSHKNQDCYEYMYTNITGMAQLIPLANTKLTILTTDPTPRSQARGQDMK